MVGFKKILVAIFSDRSAEKIKEMEYEVSKADMRGV